MNTFINETTELGEMPVDIYTKLATNRILFLYGDINDDLAVDIIATLLLIDAEDSSEKITLFINSEGGDIRSVFSIYDTMKLIESPIETICVGSAINESALILAAGAPGMRFATKNAAICVSQLIQEGYRYSDLHDAKTTLEFLQKDNKSYMTEMAKMTKKKFKDVMAKFERKQFMTSKQAKTYGIIDKVIGSK